jgi:hypothetical protein
LIINKLKKYYQNENAVISKPNLAKLSLIVKVLGYSSYIDFINSNTESFNFNDLRIDMNNVNTNGLIGFGRLLVFLQQKSSGKSFTGKRRQNLAFCNGNL